jgi:chromosome partitioning protein
MDAPRRPRIIAVSNNKGGVAKTTSTVNLGACFAEMGYRTLIIDLDPQGNASSSLGIDTRDLEHTVYDVLIQETPLEDAIEPTAVKNLFLAPSNINLAGAEIELVPAFGRESRLRLAIDPIADQWDFILIDCPPSVGLLTVNALTAASEILTPVQTEYIPLEGIDILLKNLHLIRKTLNPSLPDPTFLCVMYQRTNLADQVVEELRAKFGERVLQTVIPRNVRLSEAPSFGQPITTFDSSSTGAQAYRKAAKEIANGTEKWAG